MVPVLRAFAPQAKNLKSGKVSSTQLLSYSQFVIYKGKEKYVDFGWGGAACAYLAVDTENEISIYFGAHSLSSPTQGFTSMLYRFIRAEMIDNGEIDDLYKDLKELTDYNLTY